MKSCPNAYMPNFTGLVAEPGKTLCALDGNVQRIAIAVLKSPLRLDSFPRRTEREPKPICKPGGISWFAALEGAPGMTQILIQKIPGIAGARLRKPAVLALARLFAMLSRPKLLGDHAAGCRIQ